jgi:hypothetical protein
MSALFHSIGAKLLLGISSFALLLSGATHTITNTASVATAIATTPPTISLNGENPSHLNIDDRYSDLGATITGPTDADKNLGVHTFVNGKEEIVVQIDTSKSSTYTIEYVAKNAIGVATTSRVVIVGDGSAPVGTTTTQEAAPVINYYITQPIIKNSDKSSELGITESMLDNKLLELSNTLKAQLSSSGSSYSPSSNSSASFDALWKALSFSNKIDRLSNITLSNVSGLTDSDIPDDITASNYLPLSGGTLSGALTIPYIVTTSTTATSTFGWGINLSGGCFAVNGNCISGGGSTLSGSAGQVAYFSGTNTAVGTSSLYISTSGTIGIGTTSPRGLLDVVGSSSGTDSTLFDGARSLSLINTNTTNNTMSALVFRTNDENNLLSTGAKIASIYTSHLAGAVSADLTFLTKSAGTIAERMRITQDGSVGIGTSSPYALLSVATKNGATGSQQTLFAVASSTASATTTLFSIDNQGNTTANGNLVVSGTATSSFGGVVNAATQFVAPVGSATIPGYAFSSQQNTGLFLSSNTLFFSLQGTSRLQLSSTGLLAGTAGSFQFSNITGVSVTAPNIIPDKADTTTGFAAGIQGNINAIVGGTEATRWTSTGFGVATSTPWRKLSVTGTVGFDGLNAITGTNSSLCLSANKEVVFNSNSDSCASSLRATKHDIQDLNLDGLAVIQRLRPVSYVYNNDASSTLRYGFIAEDAAAVDSHFGSYDQNGGLSGVDDRSFTAVIVIAVQKLANTIADFAQNIVSAHITATNADISTANIETAHIKNLCVGSTCVSETEFKALLERSGQQSSASPAEPPSSTPSDTDISDTDTTSSTTEQETTQ